MSMIHRQREPICIMYFAISVYDKIGPFSSSEGNLPTKLALHVVFIDKTGVKVVRRPLSSGEDLSLLQVWSRHIQH